MFEDDKNFDRSFSVNKKSKMINTYGKSKTSTTPKKTPHYTGSLSDRLQLIDTTPTGEDPYQLGEADMREQSPIPKLMLQKTNHGRLRICSDIMGDSMLPSRRIYDAPATETSTKMPNRIKLEKRYNLPNIIPYSAPQTTTHTTTLTSNTASDACTHMSTYTHVPKPSAQTSKHAATLIPKQTSTHTPKHTSTLTSTNACTHMSTYTHTTRNTTARSTTSSHKSTHKGTKSQSGSRKSSHTVSKKATHKTPLTTPHTSPLMATLTPLHTLPPLATHTASQSSLHAALTGVRPPLGSTTHTITEVKQESIESPTSPSNLFIQQDAERVKKESDLDWPFSYSTMHPAGSETSLCDFSYGENSNLTTLPALDVTDFRQLIESDAAAAAAVTALENIDSLDYNALEKIENDKIKKDGVRNTSLIAPGVSSFSLKKKIKKIFWGTDERTNPYIIAIFQEETLDNRRGMGSKRGRKRALSTAGLGKNAKQNLSKPVGPKPKIVKGKGNGIVCARPSLLRQSLRSMLSLRAAVIAIVVRAVR